MQSPTSEFDGTSATGEKIVTRRMMLTLGPQRSARGRLHVQQASLAGGGAPDFGDTGRVLADDRPTQRPHRLVCRVKARARSGRPSGPT
jgi:hypothetical protein